jgi:hypothetical protein
MMENLVEQLLAGETEVPGENLSHCYFVHHKSHTTWQGANPGGRDGKPATNRLSYGTAIYSSIYLSIYLSISTNRLSSGTAIYSSIYLSIYGSTALCWTLATFSVS